MLPEGTELLFAPHAGRISYLQKAGDWVETAMRFLGDYPLPTCGYHFARAPSKVVCRANGYVIWGNGFAKVAGREALRCGRLLK